ncbi:hypothetical protein HYS49_03525 [Candidatus Woesearchaeota archaeon]|nr:hypothetical protein [Candidatus Woesearchaeota archaeon]
MNQELIILGDIEMGAGTLTDDFISDAALSQLIRSLAEKPVALDLVLNGDTFDFLKCPIFVDGKVTYPRHVTPDISLEKLHLIKKAHAAVFEALQFFVRRPQKKLHFIIGNHDHDLVYPEVQQELKALLGPQENVHFQWQYKNHHVYIEHGQQYDLPNMLNLQRLFVRYHGKTILNPPWAFGLLHRFMNIKEEHPFLERIFPKVALFQYHRPAAKQISRAALKFILSSIFYYPFRALMDPTYSISQKITSEMLRKLRQSKEQHFDMDSIVHIFKRKKRHLVRRYKLLVLGHVHKTYIEERKHSVIIHPGSWRDEYHLDKETGMLTPRTKNYVRIQVAGERLHWELVPVQIQRSTISFKDVVKDEKAAVCKAAAEEGFSLPCCTP